MAFVPPPHHHQYCSDHMFSNDLCQLQTPMIVSDGIAAARGGFDVGNDGLLNTMPIMDPTMTTISTTTLPHHHNPLANVSDHQSAAMLMLSSSPPPCEFPRTTRGGGGGYGCQYDQLFESGDECINGLILDSNFLSLYPSMRHPNYYTIEGIQGEGSPKLKEQPAMKIGRYSEEERKDRILRYLKKRNQRNFNKTIKYACRKTLADKRVRVRGRFAKNNEICGADDSTNDDNLHHKTKDLYYHHPFPFQAKQDEEEEWLEEAITSLMCIPYIGGSYDVGQFVNFS